MLLNTSYESKELWLIHTVPILLLLYNMQALFSLFILLGMKK